MIRFLKLYAEDVSQKQLASVIDIAAHRHDDPVLKAIASKRFSLTGKARRALLEDVVLPEMSKYDQLIDSINSMLEFWCIWSEGEQTRKRSKVFADVVNQYGSMYSKIPTSRDMIDLLTDVLGPDWWRKTQNQKELLTLVQKFEYPTAAQEPSFL